MKRQEAIYEVRDSEDRLICSGNTKVLGEYFCVTPATIWEDAKNDRVLLREYRVRKVGTADAVLKPLSPQNSEIAKCINSGTPEQNIMERFGLTDTQLKARKVTLKRRGAIR